jgi:hypothetical protein
MNPLCAVSSPAAKGLVCPTKHAKDARMRRLWNNAPLLLWCSVILSHRHCIRGTFATTLHDLSNKQLDSVRLFVVCCCCCLWLWRPFPSHVCILSFFGACFRFIKRSSTAISQWNESYAEILPHRTVIPTWCDSPIAISYFVVVRYVVSCVHTYKLHVHDFTHIDILLHSFS